MFERLLVSIGITVLGLLVIPYFFYSEAVFESGKLGFNELALPNAIAISFGAFYFIVSFLLAYGGKKDPVH